MSGDASNGGKTRIPTLTLASPPGSGLLDAEATTNEDKSAILAKLMFPTHPSTCLVLNNFLYPSQLHTPASILAEQIRWHIDSLSPHKAPGPDGIPNSVPKFCASIITPHLIPIYRAILHLKVYPAQWRESTTCVLRKPGVTSPNPHTASLTPF